MSNKEIITNFNALKKNLKKDFSGLKNIRIALIGDSATQFLNLALKGYGFEEGYHFDIYEADYNQIEGQVLDTSSELYNFKPDFVIIFQSVQKLAKAFYKSDRVSFASKHVENVSHYYLTLTCSSNAKVIYFNFPELNDNVFGNFSNKLEQSFVYQIRKINFELMRLSMSQKNFNILDYCILSSQYGKNFAFDPKVYYTSDMVLSIDILPVVTKNITDIVSSLVGKFKKCLILDLDNTMWGGIIGDDGIENIQIGDLGIGKAFTEFQMWMKQLKQRGIILAVCSKNTESIAKEPFEKHPDMVLSLDDIAVFVANWNNKADNIRYIQSILNIGFDSMVFLDDNPAEREMVRTHIPEVFVPELPEDPTLYLDYLFKLNLFETASFSEEDEHRTKQYKEEAGRAIAKQSFTNEDDFLINLKMVSQVKPFDAFTVPRIAQLSQRSNQFNLRTVRYTEDDIEKLMQSSNYKTLSFTLEDKFGNNGLIAVVILEERKDILFIETWLMSCRVLKRGMENFTLNKIVQIAIQNNCSKVIGEYIPSAKNGMVKDHYSNLGFTQINDLWELDVNSYSPRKCFINTSDV
ncbi:MAG: HAD-IIIC family phosphatase [Bacteroidota bacterium]|nr:HAD-IIIC family phosphatase [Bacteroidota bacterium]